MARGKYREWLTEEGLRKIREWSRRGLKESEIAENIGISVRTFERWKLIEVDGDCPIRQAIKKGREHAVEKLENALFKKATGFTEGDHYYPPDTGSAIFLLKNWARDSYRDKPYSPEELEGLVRDNRLKELKIKLYEKELASENPEFSKLDELILRIDSEAGCDTQS